MIKPDASETVKDKSTTADQSGETAAKTVSDSAAAGSRKLRRHIAAGGIMCLCLALALTVAYYLDAQPIQRLARRYADTTSPVLYEFAFDSADSAGDYVRSKVVVSSAEFEYTGIDTLHSVGDFYSDVDGRKEQLHYSLERLPDNQQAEGAADANQRDYGIFLLLPWAVYLVMAIGYQMICYKGTKNKNKVAK